MATKTMTDIDPYDLTEKILDVLHGKAAEELAKPDFNIQTVKLWNEASEIVMAALRTADEERRQDFLSGRIDKAYEETVDAH